MRDDRLCWRIKWTQYLIIQQTSGSNYLRGGEILLDSCFINGENPALHSLLNSLDVITHSQHHRWLPVLLHVGVAALFLLVVNHGAWDVVLF